jgi:hypothetical protein
MMVWQAGNGGLASIESPLVQALPTVPTTNSVDEICD